jgi:hypothetical protein
MNFEIYTPVSRSFIAVWAVSLVCCGRCGCEDGHFVGKVEGIEVRSEIADTPPLEDIRRAVKVVGLDLRRPLTIIWRENLLTCAGGVARGCFHVDGYDMWIDLHKPLHRKCTPTTALIHELIHVRDYLETGGTTDHRELLPLEMRLDEEYRAMFECVQQWYKERD